MIYVWVRVELVKAVVGEPYLFFALMLALGFGFGVLLRKLKLSPAIGYLLSGLVIGYLFTIPEELSSALLFFSEISILLLFFEIGFEIHVTRLEYIRSFPLYITVIELLLAVPITVGVSIIFGLTFTEALILGLIASFSSTVFTYRLLEEVPPGSKEVYKTILMVAAVEDIVIVVALAMISGAVNAPLLFIVEMIALGIAIFFIALELSTKVIAKIVKPNESGLILLIAYGLLMGVATNLIGLGSAFGAFIAGLTTSSIKSSYSLMKMFRPVRSVFLVLFLISMGIHISSSPPTPNQLTLILGLSLALVAIHTVSIVFSTVVSSGLGLEHGLETGFYLSTVSELALVIAFYANIAGLVPKYVMSVAALTIVFGSVAGSLLVNNKRRVIRGVMRRLPEETVRNVDEAALRLRRIVESPIHTMVQDVFKTVMHSVGEMLIVLIAMILGIVWVAEAVGIEAAATFSAGTLPLAAYVIYRLGKRVKKYVHTLLEKVGGGMAPALENLARKTLYIAVGVVIAELTFIITMYHYGDSIATYLGEENFRIMILSVTILPVIIAIALGTYFLMTLRLGGKE